MFRSAGGLWLALACSAAACAGPQNAPEPDPAQALDESVFRCNVEPILVKQCSYNACHGIAGGETALRVYSPGKLRATQAMTIDDLIAPLTDAEQHANFESASGFNFGITDVQDNWLLRKPLPSAEGGYEHHGGAIWMGGTNDPQYVAIRAWLTGMGVCP
ncbi:MAG TPA: hypothetical protein VLX92_11840 [Kofleriaceae bacterium]|nr:hypothetical protein [Kofleriaceae bacterium]